MAVAGEEEKLQTFLQWLQVNKVELRSCEIKYGGRNKGFGLFSSADVSDDGVLLVVPLDLAITPMRVLQDPLIGPDCRAMLEEGEVDDRFLMILFLLVERLRENSCWKPYLDWLPTTFGNPLWFSDDDLLELKGTALYRASELQKKSLMSLYEDKTKDLVRKLLVLDGNTKTEATFEDFLWANSVFWSRALNIPFPRSYVFPTFQEDNGTYPSNDDVTCEAADPANDRGAEKSKLPVCEGLADGLSSSSSQDETIWVEGLVPGIDFCNHDLRAMATWEVDGTGSKTGTPCSMYLLSAEQSLFDIGKEISISYGSKGNEELLYLYGFVMENNPDDYLMVHYPIEALQSAPFSEAKLQLLHAQKAEMRYLLPKSLLNKGFFPVGDTRNGKHDKAEATKASNFSWSGQRRTPCYIDKLVFLDDFLTALRTVAMREDELFKVSSLLEELVGSDAEREPTASEVRAAIWEVCGDSGAFQLLVDILQTKMTDLEEGTGTEEKDCELLQLGNAKNAGNHWSSIVY
ncbi:Ribulose-1,5 bisphosphate carboxylase/oxygenase large subunit N-methyltransferase, chloroplastic [Linum grandiflorum]